MWVRSFSFGGGSWQSAWRQIPLGIEVKTFSVSTATDGLYNTGLGTGSYYFLSAEINHSHALIATPFNSGGLWYLKISKNDFTNLSGITVSGATTTCLVLRK